MERGFWKTDAYKQVLRLSNPYTHYGKITKISGLTIEATGLVCKIGDVCRIGTDDKGRDILAEAVGISEHKVFLMPYQDTGGIGFGSPVVNTGYKLMIGVSKEMLGRSVDALGNPIDGGPPISTDAYYPINGVPCNPMERPPISESMELGVKCIDGLMTIGKG
ncbi:MAG TPA: flagellum-specific ATP synthase FliI, partial [Ruminococcaceae bacterium]|nr:flagellum-specific ATP synthase FliI [Oscillospiraceae bacterium]